MYPAISSALVFSYCNLRIFYGLVTPGSSSFQQYALVSSELVIKIPSSLGFDEAASIPLGLSTSFCGLYAPKSDQQGGGAQLTPFFEEGGSGKYAGKPFILFGGATSMGQYGEYHLSLMLVVCSCPSCSYPIRSALRVFTYYRHSVAAQHGSPSLVRCDARHPALASSIILRLGGRQDHDCAHRGRLRRH